MVSLNICYRCLVNLANSLLYYQKKKTTILHKNDKNNLYVLIRGIFIYEVSVVFVISRILFRIGC